MRNILHSGVPLVAVLAALGAVAMGSFKVASALGEIKRDVAVLSVKLDNHLSGSAAPFVSRDASPLVDAQ